MTAPSGGREMPWNRSALLIVDIQNYFFHPRSPAYRGGFRRIIPGISGLIDVFRKEGLPVVFAVYATEFGSPLHARWNKTCSINGRGIEIPRELARRQNERVFYKTRYSALRGTDLVRWLRTRRIDVLTICGVATNLCVESTVRDAFEEGFRVVVAEDGCASPKEDLHRASLETMRVGFADVLPIKKIREALKRRADGRHFLV